MSEKNISEHISGCGEWYSLPGPLSDVVCSTRVRLARNLADFPFPGHFKSDDSVRVQTLIFDAFLKSEKADSYQALAVAGIDPLNAGLLIERGLIQPSTLNSPGGGLVMRINGKKANSGLVCTINDEDHVRISCFCSGLDCDTAFENCLEVDELLQKSLQFAASYDFGYLTANVKDCGSGMKLSARVHLPAMAFLDEIGPFFESIVSKGVVAGSAFSSFVKAGAGIGNFYQLSSNQAGTGSELEQLINFTAVLKQTVEFERKCRESIIRSRATEITDRIVKGFSVAKFSLLLDLREALMIISDIKLGKVLGLLKGVDDSSLTPLIYRVQESHLKTVIKSGNFNFPPDISENTEKQTERLRALIIQDTFENLELIK